MAPSMFVCTTERIPRAVSRGDRASLAASSCDGQGGQVSMQRHAAIEQVRRVETTEHDIRVRDGRMSAPAPVAGRARVGAGALGPNLEGAARIDPGDATAARAHTLDLQGGNPDGPPIDRPLSRQDRLTTLDAGHIGGRPAHIEGDQRLIPRLTSNPGGAHHAGAGAREQRSHRMTDRCRTEMMPPFDWLM